ncbi:hypothetical protein HPB50_025189 [Hyalomma asiaticum]|uniref:Uncharacterized protein n=1 Tax=Hyalomma asiaticum TaxID=266040 RepID=A0ACB7TNL3_HYAAI|nr:hypothetical protein HPB50_025189 [Hyalomma asiaticum]
MDTSAAAFTTRRAKGFVTCDIHHSGDSRELPDIRMLNGCQWLQAAVPNSPSPFVMCVISATCITEFGQGDICNTLEALPVVVLLDQPIGPPHEHMLVVVSLNQGTSDSNTLSSCVLRHQSSSRRSPCKDSFHLAQCLGCENLWWMRLENVFQLLPVSLHSQRPVLLLHLLHQAGADGGPSGSKGAQ